LIGNKEEIDYRKIIFVESDPSCVFCSRDIQDRKIEESLKLFKTLLFHRDHQIFTHRKMMIMEMTTIRQNKSIIPDTIKLIRDIYLEPRAIDWSFQIL
jgi:hypothetical protein